LKPNATRIQAGDRFRLIEFRQPSKFDLSKEPGNSFRAAKLNALSKIGDRKQLFLISHLFRWEGQKPIYR